MSKPQVVRLRKALLAWYAACRRDLPWRRTQDPYAIWVSEIMLQQTRVETVVPYYERFLARFPSVHELASAPLDDVLTLWSGLGYYRRARMLHEGARVLAAGPTLPRTRGGWLEVKGVGSYTAGAVASIAFGEAVGLVDGNVARVLARIFGIDEDIKGAGQKRLMLLADEIVDRDDPGAWNQALMELGATVCTPRSPGCGACPVAAMCVARADGRQEELPVVAKKAPPKEERLQAIVATAQGELAARGERVLLVQRRAEGLFGGLWEAPSMRGTGAARRALAQQLGVGETRRAGQVIHVLSHRRLTIDVSVASIPSRARIGDRVLPEPYARAAFVSLDELGDLGIASLTRKVLRAAGLAVSARASA